MIHILNAFVAISQGMGVYPRTKINYNIGKKERIVAKKRLFDFISAYVVICFILIVMCYYCMSIVFNSVIKEEVTLKWLNNTLL